MKDTNLKIYLLSGSQPKEHKSQHEEAYRVWKETWEAVWKKEWSENKVLNSDDFTRQDEILTIFDGNNCVGLTCHNRLNFSFSSSHHDSYFNCWPEIAIKRLCKHGQNIMVGSNFTINQAYRKDSSNFRYKFLLMALSLKRLLHSNFDAATGTMRISRGMQKIEDMAGEVVLKGAKYSVGDEEINLIAFYRNEVKSYGTPELMALVDELWANLESSSPLEITEGTPLIGEQPKKKAA